MGARSNQTIFFDNASDVNQIGIFVFNIPFPFHSSSTNILFPFPVIINKILLLF